MEACRVLRNHFLNHSITTVDVVGGKKIIQLQQLMLLVGKKSFKGLPTNTPFRNS